MAGHCNVQLSLQVTALGELLQFLTWLFLPGPSLRKALGAPPAVRVDYRSARPQGPTQLSAGPPVSATVSWWMWDTSAPSVSIFCKFNPVSTTCHR